MPIGLPFVPEYITVHLGAPNSPAENVTVPFPDYIKNVASSEIYPTWPESALRANILANISFALNRIYTEWYRSKGYDFDITNSTQYDQKYSPGREVFQNISQIVDEIFNNYVVREGTVQPFFTEFCNGTTVTCPGLSQWGTVGLAEQGYDPLQILQYYYGEDIQIVENAPVKPNVESYPGRPLRLGSAGNEVATLQMQLNRISNNYPAIPKIPNINGVFGETTEDAVREFQRIFNLTVDGIVGQATWYKIKYIYNSVRRLGELSSEGIALEEVLPFFGATALGPGSTGEAVRVVQFYLAVIGYFNEELPVIAVDGIYGPETTEAVKAFQTLYGLTVDGIVGRNTWNALQDAYEGIIRTLPESAYEGRAKLFPGYDLSLGMEGEDVRDLQEYLAVIGRTYTNIPEIEVTGVFDQQTEDAVIAFQQAFGLPPVGYVGANTWNAIRKEYNEITLSGFTSD